MGFSMVMHELSQDCLLLNRFPIFSIPKCTLYKKSVTKECTIIDRRYFLLMMQLLNREDNQDIRTKQLVRRIPNLYGKFTNYQSHASFISGFCNYVLYSGVVYNKTDLQDQQMPISNTEPQCFKSHHKSVGYVVRSVAPHPQVIAQLTLLGRRTSRFRKGMKNEEVLYM